MLRAPGDRRRSPGLPDAGDPSLHHGFLRRPGRAHRETLRRRVCPGKDPESLRCLQPPYQIRDASRQGNGHGVRFHRHGSLRKGDGKGRPINSFALEGNTEGPDLLPSCDQTGNTGSHPISPGRPHERGGAADRPEAQAARFRQAGKPGYLFHPGGGVRRVSPLPDRSM